MAAALVLTASLPAFAAGSGRMGHTGLFLTDIGDDAVSPYRSPVAMHVPGVLNGLGHHPSGAGNTVPGPLHPHLARSMTEGSAGSRSSPDPVSGPDPRLPWAYERGNFHCEDVGELERAHRGGWRDRGRAAVLPQCPRAARDIESYSARTEVVGRIVPANAQIKPVEQKISIKPRYARRICKFYQEGDFERIQRYIQRKWKGLYTLEDIYLSLRCERYRRVDLLRASFENIPRSSFSFHELEKYFRKIAEANGKSSLLTRVAYCKKNYLGIGKMDFFDYMEYTIQLSEEREATQLYIKKLFQLRKVMSQHVRDFPFPELALELGPGYSRNHRQDWCEANLVL